MRRRPGTHTRLHASVHTPPARRPHGRHHPPRHHPLADAAPGAKRTPTPGVHAWGQVLHSSTPSHRGGRRVGAVPNVETSYGPSAGRQLPEPWLTPSRLASSGRSRPRNDIRPHGNDGGNPTQSRRPEDRLLCAKGAARGRLAMFPGLDLTSRLYCRAVFSQSLDPHGGLDFLFLYSFP